MIFLMMLPVVGCIDGVSQGRTLRPPNSRADPFDMLRAGSR